MKLVIEIQVGGAIKDLRDIHSFIDTLINATGESFGNFDFDDAEKIFSNVNEKHGRIIAEAGVLRKDTAENREMLEDPTKDLVGARIVLQDVDIDPTMYNAISAAENGRTPRTVIATTRTSSDEPFETEVTESRPIEKPRHLHLVKEPLDS